MSAHPTRWWFVGLCAAPILATGLYLMQLEPAASPIGGGERRERTDGPFMTRQLERLRQRNGFLPCPREREARRGGLCIEADEAGLGLLLGGVPRAALGPHAVEDAIPEGWRYVVDLSATIPDFCHLALHGPLRVRGRAVAAALLPPEAADWSLPPRAEAAHLELPASALAIDACPDPERPRPTRAEGVSAVGAPWAANPGKDEEAKPRPLPEGFVPTAPLSAITDASGLVMLHADAEARLLRWRIWDGTTERWLSLGQWQAPPGRKAQQALFAGDRLLVALSGPAQGALADIPLWANRRPVRYVDAPPGRGEWQMLAASAEGHTLQAWRHGQETWNVTLDEGWPAASMPPWPKEKSLRMIGDGRGQAWLTWRESGPGLQLWRRDDAGQWRMAKLSTGKAVPQRAVFLGTPPRLLVQVREKAATRWLGWRLEEQPVPLPREALPKVGSVAALWAAP